MENMTDTHYSTAEEFANTATHGLGLLLSLAGLAVLVGFSTMNGDAWHITSTSIFGATLVLLYGASALYHGIPHPTAKALLQKLDHAAIYLLIAGTYTPFLLINLRGAWGWSLFGVIWGLAVVGAIMEFVDWKPFKRLSLTLYLGMGWIIVIAIQPLMENLASAGLYLLIAGGLAYSLGVIFYVWEKLPYNHAVWHLFVLAGSIFHYFSILLYVVP